MRKKKIYIVLAIIVLPVVLLEVLSESPYWFNPAKKLSSVAVKFAHDNSLTQIKEYNGAATGLDNTEPFFIRIYEGSGEINVLETKLKATLEVNGYKVEDAYFTYDPSCPTGSSGPNCPTSLRGNAINGGKPYWVMKGKNSSGVFVDTELSTVSYYDTTNTLEFGEHPVPPGKFVLTTQFYIPKN